MFVLFDYTVWHSNNVPIRRAYCCVELYYIMVSCACVCSVSMFHNSTLCIRNIFQCSMCVCVSGLCDSIGEKAKKCLLLIFHFIRLLRSLCWFRLSCAQINILTDERADRQPSSWAMWIWCVFKIHWSFGCFSQHLLIVCRVFSHSEFFVVLFVLTRLLFRFTLESLFICSNNKIKYKTHLKRFSTCESTKSGVYSSQTMFGWIDGWWVCELISLSLDNFVLSIPKALLVDIEWNKCVQCTPITQVVWCNFLFIQAKVCSLITWLSYGICIRN